MNKSIALGSWKCIVDKFKAVVLRQKTHIEIYTDASYINQHKVGAICFIAVKDGQKIHQHVKQMHGKSEVYVLELTAIVSALKWATQEYPQAELEIFTDSQGAIDAINGHYKKKSFKKLSRIQDGSILKTAEYRISHIRAHQKTENFNVIADRKVRSCARAAARKLISKKAKQSLQANK